MHMSKTHSAAKKFGSLRSQNAFADPPATSAGRSPAISALASQGRKTRFAGKS